jgi:hypothetical protein
MQSAPLLELDLTLVVILATGFAATLVAALGKRSHIIWSVIGSVLWGGMLVLAIRHGAVRNADVVLVMAFSAAYTAMLAALKDRDPLGWGVVGAFFPVLAIPVLAMLASSREPEGEINPV